MAISALHEFRKTSSDASIIRSSMVEQKLWLGMASAAIPLFFPADIFDFSTVALVLGPVSAPI